MLTISGSSEVANPRGPGPAADRFHWKKSTTPAIPGPDPTFVSLHFGFVLRSSLSNGIFGLGDPGQLLAPSIGSSPESHSNQPGLSGA